MPINASGPYYAKDKPELAAYIIRDYISDFLCTVCFVILDDETQRKRIEQNYYSLFHTVINYAYEKYEQWNSIPLFICYLQPTKDNDTELHISASQIDENEIDKIAVRVLTDTIIQKNETLDCQSYQITYFGKTPETDLYETIITKDNWNFKLPIWAKDSKDLSLIPKIIEEINQSSIEMYSKEVIKFINEDNPEEAFHSFSHYALLVEQIEISDALEVLDLALSTTIFLINHKFYDYADWTANWASSIALKYGKYEQALDLLRWSGIANEGLFRINEIKASYEKALSILCNITSPRKIAQLYMSYGISLIVLAFYLDFDDSRDYQINRSIETDILFPAQNYFEKAYSIFKKLNKLTNKFPLCSIELELIRIDDLRGNHQKALINLENIINKNRTINKNPRLLITALVYTIAAARHMYKEDSQWQQQYYCYLQKAAEIAPCISSTIPDKACYIHIWIGDEMLKLGNAEAATEHYSTAYDIQQSFKQNEIRSSNPGTKYGGILAIDIAGRIQNSLLAQKNSNEYPSLVLQSFTTCEREKGRFFIRDLIFRNSSNQYRLTMYLKYKYQSLRSAFSKTSIDQRLLMSDYKWLLKWDINTKKQPQLDFSNESFDRPLSLDKIQKLLLNEKHTTAIVSFYVTNYETLVYIIKFPYNNISTLKLAVDTRQLERISQALHTGIYGNKYTSKLNYSSPEENDKLFQPLFELYDFLIPLINEIKDIDLIYICPHGLWHSIPLHAILLPPLWRKGSMPAIVYIPSIHVLELLHERYSNNQVLKYKNYGLTTAYSDSDLEAPFLNSHNTIYNIFENLRADILDTFGKQSTINKTMEITNEVSLHHIIAHGCFLEGEDAMNSGILLSEPSGLPCKNSVPNITGTMIMLNGTSASHVTLQACGLGKRLPDQGNEFWGFSRAVISAGGNSVIAPLWDTDLYSSTNFFELFYNNWLVNKQPKWKAWANAQFSMFSKPEKSSWSHFVHWAAFQFIGYCDAD